VDEREQDLGAGGEGVDEPDTLAGGEFQEELADSSDEVDRETGRYTDGRGAGEGGYAQSEEAFGDQPDTQGDDPLVAELGEEGQGDLAPEDL